MALRQRQEQGLCQEAKPESRHLLGVGPGSDNAVSVTPRPC